MKKITNLLFAYFEYRSLLLIAFTFLIIFTIMTNTSKGQSFNAVSTSITSLSNGQVVWGDYDNDGDLDAVVVGLSASSRVAKVFRNDGTTFMQAANLTPVSSGTAAWGDYDNDGDLDIFITGYGGPTASYVSKLYRNDAGTFTEISTSIVGVNNSSVAWGDFNNDGKTDIALCGISTDSVYVTKIYKNNGNGNFTEISSSLTGVAKGSIAWGDYDSDGDLDILLPGLAGTNRVTKIYRNTDGAFTEISASLEPVGNSSAVWGDYDNDGDLDILLSGNAGSNPVTKIYRNTDGNFSNVSTGLAAVSFSSVSWGDFNNNGTYDILVTGLKDDTTRIAKIYLNIDGSFSEDTSAHLTGTSNSNASIGDYDSDGDLDLLIAGDTSATGKLTRLYRNALDSTLTNSSPSVPTNLTSVVNGTSVTLSWNKSTDTKTPQNGLTYNIRVGVLSKGTEIVSPLVINDSTGKRLVSSIGNTGHKNSWTIKDLPIGTFYWSVQAIDNGLKGSSFASEKTFVVPDSNGYRTFSSLSGIGAKTVKMKFNKSGSLKESPNHVTAVAALFKKMGKNGGTFLGIEQTSSEDAKKYAWIAYKKESDLAKLYQGVHTGQSYPIDSSHGYAKVRKLVGAQKPTFIQYNNVAWAQGVLFNLNLKASNNNITPPNFGSLVLN